MLTFTGLGHDHTTGLVTASDKGWCSWIEQIPRDSHARGAVELSTDTAQLTAAVTKSVRV